ncbi:MULTISPECIES: hypothetical protein [unclassified Sinorhizobium]|uniref:hypothetical protein n=1 Tax=unclassified Sinorhizobium TaxID=2613772 RepID=UPI0023D86775|nr:MULTISPECIES: hypothetical protein [unclassified Sinorhizobium]WEJ12355.1 hypothetical protein N0Q90_22525 [Sinorhizobium sp. M103]WEJ17792.1 hypothetical protein N0Q91_21400 [Sinorhizobium sp. K101]WEJ40763.1 hypothetical protein N0R80_30490 [Sinorhizobium sp. C101]
MKLVSTFTGAFSFFGFRASRLPLTCPLAIDAILLTLNLMKPTRHMGGPNEKQAVASYMLSNEPVVISRLRRATPRSRCVRFLVLFLRGFAYLLGTIGFGFLQ